MPNALTGYQIGHFFSNCECKNKIMYDLQLVQRYRPKANKLWWESNTQQKGMFMFSITIIAKIVIHVQKSLLVFFF